ncbi:MAG: epoxide hydrolase family protein [Actinomycetaceae bacterium]
MDISSRPFRIAVPEAELVDLSERLSRTALPDETPGAAGRSGLPMSRVDSLLEHWRDGFDWRAREAALNELPQIMFDVGGQEIHVVVVRGEDVPGPRPLPVIVSHGWPYSFVEMTRLVPGLRAAGHDVVIPSLPGYGFSAPLRDQPFTSAAVAHLWNELMTQGLGHERYLTYGEDVGCSISDRLASDHPEHVAGLFATHAAFAPESRLSDLTEEERSWQGWLEDQWADGKAYAQVQGTRPDTLAVALHDSPAGLAAWIVEKLLAWSGPDAEWYWSDDDLLTTVSLYWFTRTIGTSFRAYFDGRAETEMGLVSVPVRVKVQHGERGFPRHHAARTYLDIRSWEELPTGGHFPAWQNTDDVVSGIVALGQEAG